METITSVVNPTSYQTTNSYFQVFKLCLGYGIIALLIAGVLIGSDRTIRYGFGSEPLPNIQKRLLKRKSDREIDDLKDVSELSLNSRLLKSIQREMVYEKERLISRLKRVQKNITKGFKSFETAFGRPEELQYRRLGAAELVSAPHDLLFQVNLSTDKAKPEYKMVNISIVKKVKELDKDVESEFKSNKYTLDKIKAKAPQTMSLKDLELALSIVVEPDPTIESTVPTIPDVIKTAGLSSFVQKADTTPAG